MAKVDTHVVTLEHGRQEHKVEGEVYRAAVPRKEEKRFILDVSVKEANALCAVLGRMTGNGAAATYDIYRQLCALGVPNAQHPASLFGIDARNGTIFTTER